MVDEWLWGVVGLVMVLVEMRAQAYDGRPTFRSRELVNAERGLIERGAVVFGVAAAVSGRKL